MTRCMACAARASRRHGRSRRADARLSSCRQLDSLLEDLLGVRWSRPARAQRRLPRIVAKHEHRARRQCRAKRWTNRRRAHTPLERGENGAARHQQMTADRSFAPWGAMEPYGGCIDAVGKSGTKPLDHVRNDLATVVDRGCDVLEVDSVVPSALRIHWMPARKVGWSSCADQPNGDVAISVPVRCMCLLRYDNGADSRRYEN